MKFFDNIAIVPGPMPFDINSEDEEFDFQVDPPYQHDVDHDECP